MEGLETRRLVIVAGKGGVGKTTTSCAIALRLAQEGRKTLLVTVDPAKRLEDALGVPVGFEETPVQPGLSALMLDPGAVITEHLEREVPGVDITGHPMFRYIRDYLPGLNEFMAIGKLNDLRRQEAFDVIVVDTAPTGHALSFLTVPKAMQELMSEKSLLRWAMRGYALWQRVSGAARTAGNLFKKKDDRQDAPPDVDFERIFSDIQSEARKIQAFLSHPEHAALVLVTLPERLPLEETCELHDRVTAELGMHVHGLVVNKVQPDALRGVQEAFDAIVGDEDVRARFVAEAAQATGQTDELVERLLDAAQFAEVRRAMNLGYVAELSERLPDVPRVLVPLFKKDVQGLRRLLDFRDALFQEAIASS